jgi:ribosomal protein L10
LGDTAPAVNKPRGGRAKPSERELPLRKQFLLEQYKHLFSTSPVLVFLKPGDFTVAELTKLRVDLATLPGLGSSSSSSSGSPPSADDINDSSDGRPRYMHLRAGLLPPAFAALPHLPSKTVLQQLEADKGAIAVLTMDRLDPPILKAALAAVQKLSASPNLRKIQAAASAGAKGKAAGKPAGAPAAKAGATATAGVKQEERLRVLSALIDGKDVPTKAGVAEVAALPGLQDLLAQLVSLIETPARQIIGLAAQAGGQDLVRALEGFRVGLEAKEGEGQEKASP